MKTFTKFSDWAATQLQFGKQEYENRPIPGGGFITWDNGEVVAVSRPGLGPVEAIDFYIAVELLLPNGWAGDPEITLLSDGCISIHGDAD